LSAAGLTVGGSMTGWFEALADQASTTPGRKRSCILLWMSGGPSQVDTFDCKPGHRNGGPVKTTQTAAPGVEFADYMPELAKEAKHLAIIRSMSTKEGDHARATYTMRTGYLPQGGLRYPTIGASISKELERPDAELPSFVSIGPNRFLSPEAFSPGFLGSRYAPLIVGESTAPGGANNASLKVEDIDPPAISADGKTHLSMAAFNDRLSILEKMEKRFGERRAAPPVTSHRVVYERAVRLMRSPAVKAFDLEQESGKVRDSYGRSSFGQGCLLARRLVEVGVPFVEVSLGSIDGAPAGWDTHQDNFAQVKALCTVLDKAWSQLMRDLKSRGLLETTTILWMGEFGRTPRLEGNGRNHFPAAWSTVLAGGGIKGGQVIGRTTADGMSVADRPVGSSDLLATLCAALGVDPHKQNIADNDRPIRIVDLAGKPVKEALA
jgi:hypothetical protein